MENKTLVKTILVVKDFKVYVNAILLWLKLEKFLILRDDVLSLFLFLRLKTKSEEVRIEEEEEEDIVWF